MFDFPAHPTTGTIITNGSARYQWDGATWTYPGSFTGPPTQPGTLSNNGGYLMVDDPTWPNGPTGVPTGGLYSNGGLVMVAGTTSPNPAAPAVFFGQITSVQLLALGGADLPLSAGTPGSGQLWNNGNDFGTVRIS